MAVRIRLTRTGRKNLPSYRIAVFDGRTRRDGPSLEVIGWFNPLSKEAGKGFRVQTDRLEDWIRRGARMSLAVEQLLERQGVALPVPAPKPPAARPPRRKAAAAPAARRPAMDPAEKARRLRRNARKESRRALRAKRAAASSAAAKPAAGAA